MVELRGKKTYEGKFNIHEYKVYRLHPISYDSKWFWIDI